MKKAKYSFVTRGIIIGVMIILVLFGYRTYFKKNTPHVFTTENPHKRTITQVVNVSGILAIKESFEVGSLQSGIVQEVLVKQNDHVKKDQLLCIIDTGKKDTEYREAQHLLDKAEQEYDYQKKFYHRQEQLYRSGQLSKNSFEEITKNYKKSHEDVKASQAVRDKKKMEYESTFIKSPTNGIVLAVEATRGMRTTDLANLKLFAIAHDPRCMEAVLEVDESDIGNIKEGMHVKFVTNSFPDRVIKGVIAQVSFTPKVTESVTFYKAIINIDNSDLSLRPGMIVNAKIKTYKANNVLSISGLAFQIDEATVKAASKKMGVTCVPRNKKEEMKKIQTDKHDAIVKYVWVVHDKQIVQKPVIIGITDNSYWQIIEGLSESDNVLLDIEENTEVIDDLYKKAAGGAF